MKYELLSFRLVRKMKLRVDEDDNEAHRSLSAQPKKMMRSRCKSLLVI